MYLIYENIKICYDKKTIKKFKLKNKLKDKILLKEVIKKTQYRKITPRVNV